MNATEIWTNAFLTAELASAPTGSSKTDPRPTRSQSPVPRRLMASVIAALAMMTAVAACVTVGLP